jgi:hypothetical protein
VTVVTVLQHGLTAAVQLLSCLHAGCPHV